MWVGPLTDVFHLPTHFTKAKSGRTQVLKTRPGGGRRSGRRRRRLVCQSGVHTTHTPYSRVTPDTSDTKDSPVLLQAPGVVLGRLHGRRGHGRRPGPLVPVSTHPSPHPLDHPGTYQSIQIRTYLVHPNPD